MYLELANRVVDTFDLGQLEGPVLHLLKKVRSSKSIVSELWGSGQRTTC